MVESPLLRARAKVSGQKSKSKRALFPLFQRIRRRREDVALRRVGLARETRGRCGRVARCGLAQLALERLICIYIYVSSATRFPASRARARKRERERERDARGRGLLLGAFSRKDCVSLGLCPQPQYRFVFRSLFVTTVRFQYPIGTIDRSNVLAFGLKAGSPEDSPSSQRAPFDSSTTHSQTPNAESSSAPVVGC